MIPVPNLGGGIRVMRIYYPYVSLSLVLFETQADAWKKRRRSILIKRRNLDDEDDTLRLLLRYMGI